MVWIFRGESVNPQVLHGHFLNILEESSLTLWNPFLDYLTAIKSQLGRVKLKRCSSSFFTFNTSYGAWLLLIIFLFYFENPSLLVDVSPSPSLQPSKKLSPPLHAPSIYWKKDIFNSFLDKFYQKFAAPHIFRSTITTFKKARWN